VPHQTHVHEHEEGIHVAAADLAEGALDKVEADRQDEDALHDRIAGVAAELALADDALNNDFYHAAQKLPDENALERVVVGLVTQHLIQEGILVVPQVDHHIVDDQCRNGLRRDLDQRELESKLAGHDDCG